MKIILFSDIHWSATSSMVTMHGEKYTKRLELLIATMNWIEELSFSKGCKVEICLGDFCDKSTLNDEEISALTDIRWNDTTKYFIVGNHESAQHDLKFSTVNALPYNKGISVISTPTRLDIDDKSLYFIPYITESDKTTLQDLLDSINNKPANKKKIIFSHNDIAGQNYGGFISKIGFSIEEIEKACDLYLNGHLHNSIWVTNKILNVGSTSAHNFTNDSLKYKYGAWILDTDTLKLEFYENPFSLNFYKFEIMNEVDLKKFDEIKQNAVVSIKCREALKQSILDSLAKYNILDKRITIIHENNEVTAETIAELHSDHLAKLVECCKQNIDNTEILDIELAEICK